MEMHVSLVGRGDLTGEIYRQLRRAILDGRLPPGGRLPPTRELARRLSVSRTTVTVAYDRLVGEGFLTARVGAGTYVSDGLAGVTRRAGRAGGALRPRPVWDSVEPFVFEREAEFDFRPGIPDARLVPYQTWRRLLARELNPAAVGAGHYADPAGHLGLRRAIARHLGVARGVQATAEEVVVTNGTQQAVDIVARVLLAPGDRVAVEDPCYGPPRQLLQTLGARVTGVPVDDQGLVVDAIPPGTRLVCVTPSHQFPLGMAMSLPRRMALLAWAQRHHAAIVEDDYDSEFRYGGRPIEPLQTLDASGRVIYVGSFSKTMLATLRLGFVVAPASLRRPAGGQAPDRLAHGAAAAGRAGPLHRAGLLRPPPPQDARGLPVTPPADRGHAGPPVRPAPGGRPVGGRPAPHRRRPQRVLRGAGRGAAPGVGGRCGAAAPVHVRRRRPRPSRARAGLWRHPHRPRRPGARPAPPLLRSLNRPAVEDPSGSCEAAQPGGSRRGGPSAFLRSRAFNSHAAPNAQTEITSPR
jgi:GntR family transcriptional regulator/MocR family aminotransferase